MYNKSPFEFDEKSNIPKSRFHLNHEYKNQIVPGELVPVLLEEAMPGDFFSISSEFNFAFAPLYFPMAQMYTMRCDYFFIPNRILFETIQSDEYGNVNQWEAFIMNLDRNGVADAMTNIPTIQVQNQIVTNNDNRTLASAFGLPLLPQGAGRQFEISGLNCIPFFAYLAIYDEYYRNPKLESPRNRLITTAIGADNQTALREGFRTTANTFPDRFPCLSAKWEKDYFTSATPEPQLGAELLIPSLGVEADGSLTPQNVVKTADGTQAPVDTLGVNALGELSDSTQTVAIETQATIRQLRRAEILQSFWEKVNRVGQRISDFMMGVHGTKPDNGMIQVPQMFGSTFGRVKISDVLTTALTQVTDAQGQQTGDYTGHAKLYANDAQVHTVKTQEHGYYIAILQVNPNTSYGQGIDRHWRRSIMEDFPYYMYAGIGDQEILKEELLFQNLTASMDVNNETFGYIDRFGEMKFRNNKFCGDMAWGQGLSWHAGRYIDLTDSATWGGSYDEITTINEIFVNSADAPNYPDDGVGWGNRLVDQFRVLPQGSEGNSQQSVIFAHIFHSIYVNRSLPYFSKPGRMLL